ncbi:hypothetical protein N8990_02815 [Candidatus Pelagibacter sp.]|jgi:hypothetical protein|nr:hypothetical protein [Candidatus Pelagibacter sp.]MDA9641908.1 hypothetical protein [bacterium]MDB2446809.1 hypothetical protein [Candidatus Pelagibacter bacterium]MDA7813819.1 hypothetical protein [Candidatus Pelagibacter sp.]MDA9670450.1 hypothetical protein [Candidatus Pelagibacter sp.]|tara:strand:+ start:63 stop:497 length:435 start_codon:yes stop_codon:yes gene_type:complete
MKKIIFLVTSLFIISFAKADTNISLKNYLDAKSIEDGKTQIYLLNRCSAIYAYASGIILKTDAVSSKNFIEISNNLLFKSVELTIIEEEKKLEEVQKKAEEIRKELFNNYIADGKKNWEKNKSHFKGSYIANDMTICSKLTEEK